MRIGALKSDTGLILDAFITVGCAPNLWVIDHSDYTMDNVSSGNSIIAKRSVSYKLQIIDAPLALNAKFVENQQPKQHLSLQNVLLHILSRQLQHHSLWSD